MAMFRIFVCGQVAATGHAAALSSLECGSERRAALAAAVGGKRIMAQ